MKKRVLFIGVTNYNFEGDGANHLEKKFSPLSEEIGVFVLGRGKLFHKKIWGADFFLLKRNIFFWPLAFFLAGYLVIAKKIDVVIAQSPLLEGFTGVLLKAIFKKELIVEIHGDWQEGPFLSIKRRLAFLQRKFVPFLARFSLKRADKIRVISSWTLEKARKIASQKTYFVFPTFTDLDIFLQEKNTAFEHFILFVGGLEQVKGVKFLIEAFAKISDEFPDFKLVLIGAGSELNNLKSQISNLKLEGRIEFTGKLFLEETKNIMRNCYCLVLPSLSEGLGRVLMEAMALSKPVIGSNVGGIPDLISDGQNGFLFEMGDAGQLAEKLRLLLASPELAKTMGNNGKIMVEARFSNAKYIENYLKMINT